MTGQPKTWRTLIAKKSGTARCCGAPVGIGDKVRWHPSKGVEHLRGQCDRNQLPEGGGQAPESAPVEAVAVPAPEGAKVVPLRAAQYSGWSVRCLPDGSFDAVHVGGALTTAEPTFKAAVAAIAQVAA